MTLRSTYLEPTYYLFISVAALAASLSVSKRMAPNPFFLPSLLSPSTTLCSMYLKFLKKSATSSYLM